MSGFPLQRNPQVDKKKMKNYYCACAGISVEGEVGGTEQGPLGDARGGRAEGCGGIRPGGQSPPAAAGLLLSGASRPDQPRSPSLVLCRRLPSRRSHENVTPPVWTQPVVRVRDRSPPPLLVLPVRWLSAGPHAAGRLREPQRNSSEEAAISGKTWQSLDSGSEAEGILK